MGKGIASLMKGMAAGVAIGVAAGAAGSMMLRDSKKNKRRVSKALNAVENILDGAIEFFN